jgi:hypothetical protein
MFKLCYVCPAVAPIGQLARGNSPARGADACCWRNNHDRRRLRAVNFVQISHARAVTLASGRRFYSNADVVEHRNERVRPEINIIWGAGGCARVVASKKARGQNKLLGRHKFAAFTFYCVSTLYASREKMPWDQNYRPCADLKALV